MTNITVMVMAVDITPTIFDTGADIMAGATTDMVTGIIIMEAAMVDIMADMDIIMGITDTVIIPMRAIIVVITMNTATDMGTVIQGMVMQNRIIIMDTTDHCYMVTYDMAQADGFWMPVTVSSVNPSLEGAMPHPCCRQTRIVHQNRSFPSSACPIPGVYGIGGHGRVAWAGLLQRGFSGMSTSPCDSQ